LRRRRAGETVASGLDHPWAVAFLPGGRFLVTERPGRMRVVEADGEASGRRSPACRRWWPAGRAGCWTWCWIPASRSNRTLFFCFSEPGAGGNSTALARARLAADRSRLEDVR
jgi:glucose/arabinose dehydrogenase